MRLTEFAGEPSPQHRQTGMRAAPAVRPAPASRQSSRLPTNSLTLHFTAGLGPKLTFPSRWRAPGSIGGVLREVWVRANSRARPSARPEWGSALYLRLPPSAVHVWWWYGDSAPVRQANGSFPRWLTFHAFRPTDSISPSANSALINARPSPASTGAADSSSPGPHCRRVRSCRNVRRTRRAGHPAAFPFDRCAFGSSIDLHCPVCHSSHAAHTSGGCDAGREEGIIPVIAIGQHDQEAHTQDRGKKRWLRNGA
jgi:hypothetical protein